MGAGDRVAAASGHLGGQVSLVLRPPGWVHSGPALQRAPVPTLLVLEGGWPSAGALSSPQMSWPGGRCHGVSLSDQTFSF